jgi:hypothetical protein
MKRLIPALIAYAVIATLAWFTLTGDKLQFFNGGFQVSPRDFVVTLMVIFAALTLLHHWKEQAKAKLEERRERD